MRKPATVLAMAPANVPRLFDEQLRTRLEGTASVDPDLIVSDLPNASPAELEALSEAEVLLTCWGAPVLDEAALAVMPRLRAVVHAAGSVKGFVTEAVWRRNLVVSSAAAANAVPVAEYTLAMILLSGKQAFQRQLGGSGPTPSSGEIGNYGRRVGVVGASRVGRAVLERLRAYDFDVVLADPTIGEQEAARLGVRLLDLDELVRTCDVVTIHAPDVPATSRMFDARRLGLLREGATLINTARGRLVDTAALATELAERSFFAVLDVTDPEPLPADSPLLALPNVLLTPHIAGSQGNEIGRMGALAISELERYARGAEFAHPVRREQWDVLA